MKTLPGQGPEAAGPRSVRTVQAWIEPIADDPEALSAFEVARRTLPATSRPLSLRRMRLLEITGLLPGEEEVKVLLHESTQFYNPHKERCHVRGASADASPCAPEERAVLVSERGAERRSAAERWWRRATGEPVQVREGTVWLATAEGPEAGELMERLVVLRDRHHGLLCNPHSQDHRVSDGAVPVPWLAHRRARRAPRSVS